MYMVLLRVKAQDYYEMTVHLALTRGRELGSPIRAVCFSEDLQIIGFLCETKESHHWNNWLSHCYGVGLASITLFRVVEAWEGKRLLASSENGVEGFTDVREYYDTLLSDLEDAE